MVVASPYARLLRQLLPPGRLWATAPDSNLERLLDGLGRELERIDGQAQLVPEQLDPARGSWALPDWERVLGLPDECAPPPETLEARRAAVLGRLLSGGSLSTPFYYDLARSLGYSIAIVEGSASPFRCGESACGDALGSEAGLFLVEVLIAGGTTRVFRCGESACGDPLSDTRDDFLECVLERAAPAHVALHFRYPDDLQLYLEVGDESGGAIRVYSFNGAFYVAAEGGDLIRIDVSDQTLLVRDENGDLIELQVQQEIP